MKKAKLKQLLAEAQKAHNGSSVALKDISQKNSQAKKTVKEKKRGLAAARKEYKLSRKTYRELNQRLKEARARHIENNGELEKLSKKWAKMEKPTNAKTEVKKPKRVQGNRKKVTVKLEEPPLSLVS